MMFKNLAILFMFPIACTSFDAPLRLQDRTLLIDEKSASLIYPHKIEVCKHPERKFLRRCKDKRIIKRYDLNNEITRRELIAAGFKCESKMKFQY